MVDRAGGKSAPKTESTVAGADWSDKDIGDEKHVRVGLPGADLRSATFDHVRMRDADLTGAQCQEASLRDVDLAGALLDA